MISFSSCSLPGRLDSQHWVVVREGLLPVIYVSDVPVIKRIRHQMGLIERFVLETANALGIAAPVDVEEVTGIPSSALFGVFARLELAGLLRRTGESKWEPAGNCVQDALATGEITVQSIETLGFVILPHSDDVVSIGTAKQWRNLSNLMPRFRAPVRSGLIGKRAIDLIQERISSRSCSGLSDEYIDIGKNDIETQLENTCSAYIMSGIGKIRDSRPEFIVRLHCATRGSSLRVDLSHAKNLRAQLSEFVGRCEKLRKPAVESALRLSENVLDDNQIYPSGPLVFNVEINEQTAMTCAVEGSLLSQSGLIFDVEGEWLLEFGYSLNPRDSTSARYFVLEEVIAKMSDGHHTTEEAVAILAQQSGDKYGINPLSLEITLTEVREWLWTRGRFYQVYAMRECEDFAYD